MGSLFTIALHVTNKNRKFRVFENNTFMANIGLLPGTKKSVLNSASKLFDTFIRL